jgi:HTH-type transcriptional regulator/antitoxin HipB
MAEMETIARSVKDIANIIQRHRKQRKFTQADLGERMRVRQATVSNLESGEDAIRLKTLMDALSALDLELLIRPRTVKSVKDIGELF